jgi:aspartate racemase
MRPKTIGIIGGAGPRAGACLLERLVRAAQRRYGCWQDSDFPKIILLSVPFSQMLEGAVNAAQIREQLRDALEELRRGGAAVMAIACNTLYGFLDAPIGQLISLPQLAIQAAASPLVLCTTTSRQMGVYPAEWTYLDPSAQKQLDGAITQLLQGADADGLIREILDHQEATTVVLGCTELSLIANQLGAPRRYLIDPIDLAVEQLLAISFGKSGNKEQSP